MGCTGDLAAFKGSETPRPNDAKNIRGNYEAKKANFKSFPRLPPELRQLIWGLAASAPPTFPIPGVCIFSRANSRPPMVYERRNRVLLATSTEARHVALKTPGPARDYDPEIDILYIPRSSLNSFRAAVAISQLDMPDWVVKTRHLALPSTEANRVLAGPDFLAGLYSLETLSLVYPASSGTFDYFEEVKLPAKEVAVRLRRLTEEESAGIRVRADYTTYIALAGTFQIRWSRSGDSYLQWAEATLNRACHPAQRGGRGVAGLWDETRQRLRISYEARCFEALPVPKMFDG